MTSSFSPARAPLSVLDLVPVPSGSDSRQALLNTVDLAQRAEASGYARYWLAEHHLNPGIAGSAPHALIAALGAATDRIRIGTAATVLGNHRPLAVAESFGTAAGLYGQRFDLGLGRSGIPVAGSEKPGSEKPGDEKPHAAPDPAAPGNRVVDGLVIPPPYAFRADRMRFALQFGLLGRTPGDADGFETSVRDLLAFFDGTYLDDGDRVPILPAEGSGVDVWIHGSTAGESARIAGSLGLPYGANYHVAPSAVLESVAAYRSQFVPGRLPAPHVIVSVDVVVGRTDAEARELATGHAEWVHSIRGGRGAIPYPTPDEARAHPLGDGARALVQDRLDTRFVGDPAAVVAHLETLQRATAADELLVTTITHDHAARVRSYELLAEAWGPAPLATAGIGRPDRLPPREKTAR